MSSQCRFRLPTQLGARGGRLPILIFHRVLPHRDLLFQTKLSQHLIGRCACSLSNSSRCRYGIHCGICAWRQAAASRICLCDDDGYADNPGLYALPILQRYGVPPCSFATGYIGSGIMFNAIIESAAVPTRLGSGGLGTWEIHWVALKRRRKAISDLIRLVKCLAYERLPWFGYRQVRESHFCLMI